MTNLFTSMNVTGESSSAHLVTPPKTLAALFSLELAFTVAFCANHFCALGTVAGVTFFGAAMGASLVLLVANFATTPFFGIASPWTGSTFAAEALHTDHLWTRRTWAGMAK